MKRNSKTGDGEKARGSTYLPRVLRNELFPLDRLRREDAISHVLSQPADPEDDGLASIPLQRDILTSGFEEAVVVAICRIRPRNGAAGAALRAALSVELDANALRGGARAIQALRGTRAAGELPWTGRRTTAVLVTGKVGFNTGALVGARALVGAGTDLRNFAVPVWSVPEIGLHALVDGVIPRQRFPELVRLCLRPLAPVWDCLDHLLGLPTGL